MWDDVPLEYDYVSFPSSSNYRQGTGDSMGAARDSKRVGSDVVCSRARRVDKLICEHVKANLHAIRILYQGIRTSATERTKRLDGFVTTA